MLQNLGVFCHFKAKNGFSKVLNRSWLLLFNRVLCFSEAYKWKPWLSSSFLTSDQCKYDSSPLSGIEALFSHCKCEVDIFRGKNLTLSSLSLCSSQFQEKPLLTLNLFTQAHTHTKHPVLPCYCMDPTSNCVLIKLN